MAKTRIIPASEVHVGHGIISSYRLYYVVKHVELTGKGDITLTLQGKLPWTITVAPEALLTAVE